MNSQDPSSPIFLVTGASGFTGGHLVSYLRSQGIKVRALVRNAEQAKQLKSLGVEIALGQLEDAESVARAVEGIEGVYHIAALFRQAGVAESLFRTINVEGTRILLQASIKAGVKRFIHCSTVGVLGDVANPPGDETTPYNPGDPYQQSKMEGEQLVLDTLRSGAIDGVVIRPAMIYGPGDRRTLKLFSMLAKRRFFYVGDGNALVHFIDVRDLARAFHLAMQHTERTAETYIIAGDTSLPLQRLVQRVCRELEVEVPRLHLPVKPMQLLGTLCETLCRPLGISPPIFRRRVDFFTKNRSFDTRKAREELGFRASRTLDQEIQSIIAAYRDENLLPPPTGARMLRTLEGNIAGWDEKARICYGYHAYQAVGTISHSLLKTEFPYPLEDINRQLLESKVWQGPLIHTCSDGRKVQVLSRWELRSADSDPATMVVVETNRNLTEIDNNSSSGKVASLITVLHSLASSVGEVLSSGGLSYGLKFLEY